MPVEILDPLPGDTKYRLIVILDDPEPDPPNGECYFCGGAIPGWSLQMGEERGTPFKFCFDCSRTTRNCGCFPRFERINEFMSYPKEIGGITAQAGLILYLLEKEIVKRAKRRTRTAG